MDMFVTAHRVRPICRVVEYLLLFTFAACGGNVEATEPQQAHDASPDARDAGVDHELEAAPEAEASSDAARDAARDAGGLLCCATGQNLLVCDPSSPWTCVAPPTHPPPPCTDTAQCGLGAQCNGFNGVGTVVACGM